MSWLSQEG